MKRIFISQPMNGIDDEVILAKRNELIDIVTNYLNIISDEKDFEIVSSFFTEENTPGGIPEDVNGIWYLGRAIQMMYNCDHIIFADGWQNARGCQIEMAVAKLYGINQISEFAAKSFIDFMKNAYDIDWKFDESFAESFKKYMDEKMKELNYTINPEQSSTEETKEEASEEVTEEPVEKVSEETIEE